MTVKYKNIPLYRGIFAIAILKDDEHGEFFNKFGVAEEDRHDIWGSTFQASYMGQHAVVIALNISDKQFPVTYGLVVHELLHAVNYVAISRGFKSEYGMNEEAEAYLVQWMADFVFGELNKLNIDIK